MNAAKDLSIKFKMNPPTRFAAKMLSVRKQRPFSIGERL